MKYDYITEAGKTITQDTLDVVGPRATDEKEIAQRKWQAPLKAPAEQKPCDVGLFSDDAAQRDLL